MNLVTRAVVEIKDGKKKLRIGNEGFFQHHLQKFPEGKVVWITLDTRAPKRSNQQNAYYWLCLREISLNTGLEETDIHEYLKGRYLPKQTITIAGDSAIIPPSTTKLSKLEFGEYMEKVIQFAADQGILLPDPSIWKKELDPQ